MFGPVTRLSQMSAPLVAPSDRISVHDLDNQTQLDRIKAEIADSFDEELEMQLEEDRLDELVAEGMTRTGRADAGKKDLFSRTLPAAA